MFLKILTIDKIREASNLSKASCIILFNIPFILILKKNICYNLGNDSLSMSISVPISNCGPSCVAFLVGVLYKEIKGIKNFLILMLGTLFALVGSILCGLSL